MFYLKWTEPDIADLGAFDKMVVLYTEIDNEGIVHKEIGLDNAGKVIHKSPSSHYRYGEYGIFDNQKVALPNEKANLTKEEFDRLWESD
ncbi:MAG: hypothetical protein ABIK92_02505 [Pseudomonadota bacterium]